MTTHELLVAAKGYLLNYGWQQGIGGDGGPRCMVGAVCSVERRYGLPERRSVDSALAKAIKGSGAVSLAHWNDKPDRTFDEVIAAFDRAIIATAPEDTPTPSSVTHVFA